jgi:hypothetical protein
MKTLAAMDKANYKLEYTKCLHLTVFNLKTIQVIKLPLHEGLAKQHTTPAALQGLD